MKRIIVLSSLLIFVFSACGKKEEKAPVKEIFALEPGSQAYQLAKDLAALVPALDPEANTLLVDANEFVLTTGEVIQTFLDSLGTRALQLKQMPAESIIEIMNQKAHQFGERKLILYYAAKKGLTISEEELDAYMEEQYSTAGGEDKFLESLKSEGIDIQDVYESVRKDMLVQKYVDEVMIASIQVSEEEIREVYETDKTASVRHILLMTQGKSEEEQDEIYEKIEGILKRARAGENFAALARQYTEDPGSKENGGLYEDFGRGVMVKPFEEAAFTVPVGEVSDIVETKYGYHILKVVNRKKEARPLEEVREEIETELKVKKQMSVYFEEMEKLKEESGFKVIPLQ